MNLLCCAALGLRRCYVAWASPAHSALHLGQPCCSHCPTTQVCRPACKLGDWLPRRRGFVAGSVWPGVVAESVWVGAPTWVLHLKEGEGAGLSRSLGWGGRGLRVAGGCGRGLCGTLSRGSGASCAPHPTKQFTLLLCLFSAGVLRGCSSTRRRVGSSVALCLLHPEATVLAFVCVGGVTHGTHTRPFTLDQQPVTLPTTHQPLAL